MAGPGELQQTHITHTSYTSHTSHTSIPRTSHTSQTHITHNTHNGQTCDTSKNMRYELLHRHDGFGSDIGLKQEGAHVAVAMAAAIVENAGRTGRHATQ